MGKFYKLGKVQVSEDVYNAIKEKKPLVFGESTIFLTGLDWPSNFECYQKTGEVIRKEGAEPAPCFIIDGIPTVGCPDDLMKELCERSSKENRDGIVKVNMSNFGVTTFKKQTGATTISASAHIARTLCKEQFGKTDFTFATGGIGGIGKNAGETFDISNDTIYMANHRFAIFSSFDKKIMDLPAVRERAETDGVMLAAVGQDTLPAFYCKSCGLKPDVRVDTVEEMVDLYNNHKETEQETAVNYAVPCPDEFALPSDILDELEAQAIQDAADQGITSRFLTPYLLGRIRELTLEKKNAGVLKNDSLDANLALFYNNNKVAAQFAVAIAK